MKCEAVGLAELDRPPHRHRRRGNRRHRRRGRPENPALDVPSCPRLPVPPGSRLGTPPAPPAPPPVGVPTPSPPPPVAWDVLRPGPAGGATVAARATWSTAQPSQESGVGSFVPRSVNGMRLDSVQHGRTAAQRRVGSCPVQPEPFRDRVSAELEAARAEFHVLLASASPADLRRRRCGTRWTNQQLLFHMLFRCIMVRALLVLGCACSASSLLGSVGRTRSADAAMRLDGPPGMPRAVSLRACPGRSGSRGATRPEP